MDLVEAIVGIYERDAASTALATLGRALSEARQVEAVAWVATDGSVADRWSTGGALPGYPAEVLGAGFPSVHPLPGGLDLLALSLGNGEALLIFAPEFAFADPREWEPLGRAFGRVVERERQLAALVEERDALRLRAEESEALHTLGLAANRSLDPDEVITLVARFTRTLLGAHYVTVSTVTESGLGTAAAVGLRSPETFQEDGFAADVIACGKPVSVDAGAEGTGLERYPRHAREGLRVGLGLPLTLFGKTFGALVIGYRNPYPLRPRDTRLAFTLAGHAAVAINNARLHRTIADHSRELERAYEELRWSAEAKERFFAAMSHELRTPLNAVLGYQSLLLEGVVGELPEPVRPLVENAQRATRSLLLLVNDVLDLAKIEAGKVDLNVRSVSLGALIHETLATIRPLAEAKGLRLRTSLPDAPCTVDTDADRVRQILLNLLSNAVKFTEEGEVAITLQHAGPEADGQGWLEIRVDDTGPGIAAPDHERIFHEFEQVIGPAARGGTGLGLPISRKLSRILGGDLVLESEPGHGATFILRLPTRAGTRVANVAFPV